MYVPACGAIGVWHAALLFSVFFIFHQRGIQRYLCGVFLFVLFNELDFPLEAQENRDHCVWFSYAAEEDQLLHEDRSTFIHVCSDPSSRAHPHLMVKWTKCRSQQISQSAEDSNGLCLFHHVCLTRNFWTMALHWFYLQWFKFCNSAVERTYLAWFEVWQCISFLDWCCLHVYCVLGRKVLWNEVYYFAAPAFARDRFAGFQNFSVIIKIYRPT